MANRRSPLQENYAVPQDFVLLAKKLKPDAINILLDIVWQGYDRLRQGDHFDVTQGNPHLEDEITVALYARIQDTRDPFSPFEPLHQWPEGEKKKPKGRSPQSDLGFRIRGGNVRSHFSIEAKILRSDGAVSYYVKEVNDNFLTGRYSTFSSEAAMLGYMLSGSTENAFNAIAKALRCPLAGSANFPGRAHRRSSHVRNLAAESGTVPTFKCHHLLMFFGQDEDLA